MLALGIDPDLHNTALALVRHDPALGSMLSKPSGYVVERVCVCSIDKRLRGAAAVMAMENALYHQMVSMRGWLIHRTIVEGQEIYRGKTGNPADILRIAQVAGGALASAQALPGDTLLPTPNEWKGSVPKEIHQGRTCTKLGWRFEKRAGYVVPIEPDGFVNCGTAAMRDSDWKHVLDAIGLAIWGIEQAAKAARRAT